MEILVAWFFESLFYTLVTYAMPGRDGALFKFLPARLRRHCIRFAQIRKAVFRFEETIDISGISIEAEGAGRVCMIREGGDYVIRAEEGLPTVADEWLASLGEPSVVLREDHSLFCPRDLRKRLPELLIDLLTSLGCSSETPLLLTYLV